MNTEIRNPYRLPFFICLALSLACLAIGLGLLASLSQHEFQRDSRDALLATSIFSLIGSFGLLVSALMIGLVSRKVRQYIAIVRNADYLAKWTYRPEEWAAFQVTESPQLALDFRTTVVRPLLIGTPIGLLVLAIKIFSDKKPDIYWLMYTVIGIGLFLVAVLGVAYYTRVVRPRAWGKQQLSSPPVSFVHREFVYANGDFLFGFLNQTLVDVQFIPGPPAQIGLAIKSYVPRVGEMIEARRVLVPEGQESKAHEIISTIREAWGLP